MTSPVGHTLGGLISNQRQTFSWPWLLYIIFAANAADLDFVAGALVGQFNRFHHMASHSIMAAIIFAGACYIVSKLYSNQASKIALVGGLAYLSHLLLDAITIDSSAPRGMQLLWPFSDEYYIAPVTFFTNIHHGARSDTLLQALSSIFSMHNLGAMVLELIILLPILLLMKWRQKA